MSPRKLPITNQTPLDRVSTITHLADTIKHNSQHAMAHAKEAVKQAKKSKDPNAITIQHNAQHALNHVIETAQHADKLIKHLKKYPGGKATLDELNSSPPSKTPGPPGKPTRSR